MKKLLLSFFVIFTFGFYAFYQRQSEPLAIMGEEIANISTTAEPKSTSTIAMTTVPKGQYKNGTYTGKVADAFYGNMQVRIVISGGKLVDIFFLDYPRDQSTSRGISSYALPLLKEEAIKAQSANIDGVSGASATSPAFKESLSSALALAKN